ncbi:hypothetical protein [uncultured Ferrimonas sp.]|uniref:hypothetical protein n=1 Tax=uncultured Ferrimonas sp. TaxID=432640 RepID=UPI002617318C|nr:hypothetical protein [uncultured Ferrimonas sp.]
MMLATSATSMATEMPNISLVLDGYYQDGDRENSHREDGFGLGETELALSGAIDDQFFGKVTTIIATEDGSTEVELEEAFIQTLALPYGLSLRAGRFMSDIGYLNSQHLHSDAFVERPAVYRSFLGGHYFDDGVRLNWVAPTDTYLTFGVEVFSGDPLIASADSHDEHEEEHEEEHDHEDHGDEDHEEDDHGHDEEAHETESIGVIHGYAKLGGDIGLSQSWQLGLSYLHNRNGMGAAHAEEEHAEEDAHGHSHGASYTGEKLLAVDAVYKWAPEGNYKHNHLTLSAEYMRLEDSFEGRSEDHSGWYVSSVYQINPSWSAGLRYGEVDVTEVHLEPHDDHFHTHFEDASLKESEVMVAWHNSHFSTVRLQYSNIDGALNRQDDNVVTLQFVMALGAHGAHQF